MSFLGDGETHVLLALAVTSIIALVYTRLGRAKRHSVALSSIEHAKSSLKQDDPLAAYHAIDPLPGFEWESTPPIKIRPFKPKYHLTMGECSSEISNRETCPRPCPIAN
jgi:hypothetical protein